MAFFVFVQNADFDLEHDLEHRRRIVKIPACLLKNVPLWRHPSLANIVKVKL